MISKGFALGVMLLMAAPSAYAADVYVGSAKDAVYAAPAVWTGFYAGVSLGASLNHSRMTGEGIDPNNPGQFTSLEGYSPTNPTGTNTSAVGSLETGYNWQSRDYVFGIAADISRLNSKSTSATTSPLTADTMSIQGDYLSTIRARLGYAVTGSTLLYGTGGLAIVRFSGGYLDVGTPDPGNKLSDTQWGIGWTAGAGIDYRLAQNWFLRGEYLHVSASANLSTNNIPEVEAYTQVSSLQQDLFKLGIFYQF